MRDMKARSMGKAGKGPGSRVQGPGSEPKPETRNPKPHSGRRGLERGLPKVDPVGGQRNPHPDEPDEPELLDELDEAVHTARGDGHFAPTPRRYQRDDDEHDCPDEPPPGWED